MMSIAPSESAASMLEEPAVPHASAAEVAAELEAPSWHARVAAVKGLKGFPLEEVLPHVDALVVRLSSDQEVRVRVAAADILGGLGSSVAKHAEALAARLDDAQSQVRQAAVRALGRLGAGQVAPRIARLLEDGDPDVRHEAIQTLATLGPEAAGTSAASQLRHADDEVRTGAQRALLAMMAVGKMRNRLDSAGLAAAKELRSHVQAALGDSDSAVRRAASEVLEQLDGGEASAGSLVAECGAARLEDQDEEVRLAAVRQLATLGAGAAPHAAALANRLADSSAPVRRAAVEALAELGEVHAADAVPHVADLLQHPLQTVRRAAATVLGHLGASAWPHGIARHAALLADESPTVRCSAVEALLDLGSAEELGAERVAAIVALRIDPHWCVRLAVAKAFRQLGSATSHKHREALDVLAIDKDWRVSREASAVRSVLRPGTANAGGDTPVHPPERKAELAQESIGDGRVAGAR